MYTHNIAQLYQDDREKNVFCTSECGLITFYKQSFFLLFLTQIVYWFNYNLTWKMEFDSGTGTTCLRHGLSL